MKKQEYIEKAKKTILNRVRFHAPIVYDDTVDKTVLYKHGVDVEKPIFKFDKCLDNKLLKAFELAQKEEEFNLLLTSKSLTGMKEKKLGGLKNAVVYDPQLSSVSFVEMINKMNINYQSSSNYNLVFKDKFFKINDQILNPHYDEFELKYSGIFDNVFVKYSEFILNGNNFYLTMQNKSNEKKKIKLELNLPLKKAYYYFKKESGFVSIENLISKEKMYLNYVCRNAKFSFSNVDGLENSVYCCVNIKLIISLDAGQEKFVLFNFGTSKFKLRDKKQIESFRKLANCKACEIFNVRVKTKNPKFDLFFNKTLPQRIWINWLNQEFDEGLEEKYSNLKRMFIKGEKSLLLVQFKEIGLKELGIFNGEYFKKLLVVRGQERYLRVGQTCFYNVNGITSHSLKSKEPISVSFGDDV